MESRNLKRESEGAEEDESGGVQTGKGRRRNVEKHLAAERERRKHVKEKLQELDNLLPESTSGPRTLNQTLQMAIEFVKRQKSRDSQSSRRHGKMNSGFPAFDSSPLVKALTESDSTGFVVLNNEWDIVKANLSFCRLLGLPDGDVEGSVLKGRSLFSVVHAVDVLGLREYASQLSASKNPAGDKVLLNLRFIKAADHRMEARQIQSNKTDIMSLPCIIGSATKMQILLVYLPLPQQGVGSQENLGDGLNSRQRELMRSIALLADLDPVVPLFVVSRCSPVSVLPNTVIIQAGTAATSIYFIESGDVFGEMGIMGSTGRTADVRSAAYCELWTLSMQDLQQVVSAHPEILHRLKVLAEGRMRHNKAWLHSQLGGAAGMQQGGMGMAGMPHHAMLDVGPVHKPTVDFRPPMPKIPSQAGDMNYDGPGAPGRQWLGSGGGGGGGDGDGSSKVAGMGRGRTLLRQDSIMQAWHNAGISHSADAA